MPGRPFMDSSFGDLIDRTTYIGMSQVASPTFQLTRFLESLPAFYRSRQQGFIAELG